MENLAKSATARDFELEVNGFRFAAKSWGDPSGKPVLGLHGWLDNANTFARISPLLNNDIYLVAVDMAGHGYSQHRSANTSYYLWDYALDVLRITDVLGWKQFSILAHSMGTGIAAILSGCFPEKVVRQIFIDGLGAPFVMEEEQAATYFYDAFRQLEMARKVKLYGFSPSDQPQFPDREAAIKDRMKSFVGNISAKAASYLADRALTSVPGGFRWNHDPRLVLPEFFRMTELQARSFISRITAPTTIILGKQGLFNNTPGKERIATFPSASVVWLQGNHHLHLEEAYTDVANTINNFLK